jgi:uncharacterized damage-inducible protein DinB
MRNDYTADHQAVRLLIAANVQVLTQGVELLRQIDDQLYTTTDQRLFAYGVGAHFRHCLDSYQSFIRGLSAGHINYDQRERDERIAQNRAYAVKRIEGVIESLRRLSPAASDRSCFVRQDAADWAQSSLKRELQFLLSHTVHHYALIALMLRAQGYDPAAEFGVAPSTLAYWREAA